jgi:multiple sugar transport system permease protein
MKATIRKKTAPLIRLIIAMAIMLYCLFPIFWLVLSSVKPREELFLLPVSYIAKNPTFEYYADLFIPASRLAQSLPFIHYMLNSLIVAGASVIIVVFLSSIAGYGFSRFKFKGNRVMLLSLIVTRMLPGPALMLPIYLMISRMGLLDNLLSLIIVHSVFGLPLGIWLSASFIDNVPIEVEEAAIVDGCTRIMAFFRVVLPMSWIGIASVGIFHFVGSWSEFAFASILLESQKMRTAPVGLAEFVFLLQTAQINKIGAAAVVMSVPIVVLFMLVQKHFVRGFVAGSVKG